MISGQQDVKQNCHKSRPLSGPKKEIRLEKPCFTKDVPLGSLGSATVFAIASITTQAVTAKVQGSDCGDTTGGETSS